MRDDNLLLIFSQTFVPDPASVGQHMADVAIELARRGRRVRVYASARGYDDPSRQYPKRENLQGVDVRRLPFASFGKKSILTRALGTFTFQFQVLMRGLFTPNLGGIFFSTSPPLVGVIACMIGLVRRRPVAYWAMDLNPDQLIALGKLTPGSITARFLERINRWILNRSALVIALDRFMAERLKQRADLDGKLLVMPPWPHEDRLDSIAKEANPFIAEHGLAGKFVIMYSGNHSPSNPLDTLLEAAAALREEDRLRFLFVGGGVGKKAVEEFARQRGLGNVICLPYQPLENLKYSLTAADVHVVSLGQQMAGIVHPCKIYGAMAAGIPVLFLGPSPSHISDLLEAHPIGWRVAHGDISGAIATIREIVATDPARRRQMGNAAAEVLGKDLSQSLLCGRFCDQLEWALGYRAPENLKTAAEAAGTDNVK
ncbi:MAG TPA: glycosyltransferase family 4 protein [Tepidisphaeraceae bacterium]|nr:glycosyltransferase family 4 protein [Tepidisphaeraceae bacterium]